MKTCTKCGETKPTTEFHKHSKSPDGRQAYCKDCNKRAVLAWEKSNPDKARIKKAKYLEANTERERAYQARYRAENSARRAVVTAAWASANKESRRIHSHNRRARERVTGGRLSTGLAERLLMLQRGKCACGCKRPLGADYHLDHIIPLALGGTNTDDNIQLLRSTCNQQKHAKHPVDFMRQRGFLL